ncbi:MAG: ribosomal protein S18-alanine N-acetyltransferase [Deltaproteobacteria bacterium]|nr:ribosomal protein S18-alanine N-acetyltransferase [Deltaproteobacteria bacterium]
METCSLKKTWPDFQSFADQILEIENSSFPVPWSAKAFEEELNRGISNLWALVSEKRVVAYICFWMFDEEIHILNFAVHSQNRNTGLGKILLKHVIEAGAACGVENIWLEVRPSNIPALSIYKKFGFVETGLRKGYYSDSREDAIIMALDLNKIAMDKASNCCI